MGSLACVPAAGAAERFGGRKMLAALEGQPLLERTIRSLLAGGVDEVVVVLGPEADLVRAAVPALNGDPRVRGVVNPDPSRGMFSSLQVGLRGASADPVVVLPGDMPFVQPATVTLLLDAYRRTPAIVSPRRLGKRGHPVVLPPAVVAEILLAEPSANLHQVLHAHPDQRVDLEVEDRGVVRDVDTVGDLTA